MKQKKRELVSTLLCTLSLSTVATEYDITVGNDDGSGLIEGSLSWGILQANNNNENDTITLKTDVVISGVMKRLVDSNITIQSDSTKRTISGNDQFRPLFIKSGEVIINNTNITNGAAKGGDSGIGGAGAGLGGGIFIYDGSVTLSNVTISHSRAVGGISTGEFSDGDGGGGMYGNAGENEIAGGLFGTPYGGYGNYRNIDPWFGGQRPAFTGYGHTGRFGGGGSYGDYEDFGGYSGGFGAGGGAGWRGHGYMGNGGLGGFGAGRGSIRENNVDLPGGGGKGLGGGIFIRTGSVFLSNVTIQNNTATSDQSEGKGGGIYILNRLTNPFPENDQGMPNNLPIVNACQLNINSNLASTFDDNIFDDAKIMNNGSGINPEVICVGVKGNTHLIQNGDTSPNVVDYTDFGVLDTNLSQSITHVFDIKNNSMNSANLTGSSLVSINGKNASDFSISTEPSAVISPNSTSSFEVTFDPASLGKKNAQINIEIDTVESYTFDITGQAIDEATEIEVRGNSQTIINGQTETSLIDNTNFNGVSVNNVVGVNQFEILNLGNLDLELTGFPEVNITGADSDEFEISMLPGSTILTPGQQELFELSFNPTGPGIKTANIEIANNDADESLYQFMVQGEGFIPIMKVYDSGFELMNDGINPVTIPAARTNFSWYSLKHISIVNEGSTGLNIDQFGSFGITGKNSSDFEIYTFSTPSQTGTLAPGEEGTLQLKFNPSYYGSREAVLHINTDDFYNNSFQHQISGVGYLLFSINSAGSQINEGSDFSFSVRLETDGIDGFVLPDYEIEFDYEIEGQVGESDFEGVPLTGTITLPSGQSNTGIISFPTTVDGITENSENFSLKITSAHPYIYSGIRGASFTLNDYDDGEILFKNGFDN